MAQMSQKTSTAPVFPAVAANHPTITGLAPAPAGASSLTVTEADAAGLPDKAFSFPVTIFATASISGALVDEARNTIGCDLRNALAEESAADLDNGGTITFDSFVLADVAHTVNPASREAAALAKALRALVRSLANPEVADAELLGLLVSNGNVRLDSSVVSALVNAREVLARIDGEA